MSSTVPGPDPGPASASNRRAGPSDRRRRPTRPWDVFFTPGRRHHHRRAEDALRHPVLDRHGPRLRLLVLSILLLTLLDGALTPLLIDDPSGEANPLMAYLLARHGALGFLLGKYALTALCMPPLLIWKNHGLFGTRFRVKYLLPIFVLAYLLLTAAQSWALLSPHGPVRRAHHFRAAYLNAPPPSTPPPPTSSNISRIVATGK